MEWTNLIKVIDDNFSVVPNLVLENGRLIIYTEFSRGFEEITLYPSTYQDIIFEADMYLEDISYAYKVYCESLHNPDVAELAKEATKAMEFLTKFIDVVSQFLKDNPSINNKELPYL